MTKYRINIKTGQKEKDNGQLGASFYNKDWREATTTEVKAIEFEKLKEAKILEVKQKRDFKLSNYSLKEGVLRTNNRAETFIILERYTKNIDQNKILAEFGLKNGVLVKLTKPIIAKWLGDIEEQYNKAWVNYRETVKKIDNCKTIAALKKIII